MQQIQLNIIPFTPVQSKLTFSFYGEKIINAAKIKWDKILSEFPEDRNPLHKSYYCDFKPAREGAIEKEIDVYNAINFTQQYFRHLIEELFTHFEGVVVKRNFTDEVEVWLPAKKENDEKFNLYYKFTLKVQFGNIVKDTYELLVAYNGKSKVFKKSIAELTDIDHNNIINVVYNNRIYNYETATQNGMLEYSQNIYPILNNDIKRAFHLEEEFKKENRYPVYHKLIATFYRNFLNKDEFLKIINLRPEGFYIIPNTKELKVKRFANLLQFRKGTHQDPLAGIRTLLPFDFAHVNFVRIFLIYHKQDEELINNTIYKYLEKGWHEKVNGADRNTKNLSGYINQSLQIDKAIAITFEDENTIFEEVEKKLSQFSKKDKTTYLALYISPVSKADKTHVQYNAYFKIKKLLLNKAITSQVIYRDHLMLPDGEFYYFIPNIFVAILAKLGGIPWLIAPNNDEAEQVEMKDEHGETITVTKPAKLSIHEELVIGFGAFKPKEEKNHFLGSAFCFDNDGLPKRFHCFENTDINLLLGSIKDAVEEFIATKPDLKRVVIHFYKEISKRKELDPINKMLKKLQERETPVVIVSVFKTDSKELLGFDLNSNSKMPVSGTYIPVGRNKYLLFNSIRYKEDDTLKPKDYHFPVKLTIRCDKENYLNGSLLRDLVNQVYQFSRIYWKSISQQNMPVTTIYPEMVAEIFPHFKMEKLPSFAENNLWFL